MYVLTVIACISVAVAVILSVWMDEGSSVWGEWWSVAVHEQCYSISCCQSGPPWHHNIWLCLRSSVDGICWLWNPTSCSDMGFSMYGHYAV